MTSTNEPRNPLYLLLIVIGLLFVVTAVAYAVIPVLEQKAQDKGEALGPSPFRDALRRDGGTWILCELAVLVVIGIASMVLDRLRSLKRTTTGETISPRDPSDQSP
jgi:amino acid transporter